jgi:hypothetical protein
VHRHLGCPSLAAYADRFLGLGAQQLQERLRGAGVTRAARRVHGSREARGPESRSAGTPNPF